MFKTMMHSGPNPTEPSEEPDRVRVRELLAQSQRLALDIHASRLSCDDVIIEGHFRRDCLRPGLSLHVSDAVERCAFTTQSILPQSLSCIFFLKGEIDISMGARSFVVGGPRNRAPEGLVVSHAEPDSFTRHSREGQHVRHAVITMTPEWLDLDGLRLVENRAAAARSAQEHLSGRTWQLSARIVALLEQIIAPPKLCPTLRSLYLESRAIEIVTETLCALNGGGGVFEGSPVSPQDKRRLQRATTYIEAHLDQAVTLDLISREAGASPNALQRFFRDRHGTTVFEYVRLRRLERARDALASDRISVAEAALLAGYSSAANFATAFKRRYGVSPRHTRRPQDRK